MYEVLASLAGLVIGVAAANAITSGDIARDCESMGMFRINGKVFICEVKK